MISVHVTAVSFRPNGARMSEAAWVHFRFPPIFMLRLLQNSVWFSEPEPLELLLSKCKGSSFSSLSVPGCPISGVRLVLCAVGQMGGNSRFLASLEGYKDP